MAIKFVSVKCPECGATLDVEEGRKQLFCSYCGTKVMIDNDNEYIYRHIDEAGIKQAEADKLIRLKELELEEKENEKSRKGRYLAFAIAGGLAAIGALSEFIVPENLFGMGAIVVAMWIALFAVINGDDKKKKKARRIISSNEVQISEKMQDYEEKNYNSIVALYKAAGFTNINIVPLCDLNIFTSKKNGQVEDITIDGDSDFDEGDVFSKLSNVTITYHSMK